MGFEHTKFNSVILRRSAIIDDEYLEVCIDFQAQKLFIEKPKNQGGELISLSFSQALSLVIELVGLDPTIRAHLMRGDDAT